MESVESTVERPDVTLWARTCGQGPPIVFLHGLAGYGAEWIFVVRELDDEFRVITVDQRGHGRSTRRPSDLTRRAYTEDVAALLEAMSPGCPVTLVGQSMGAHTAMLAAAGHPHLVERLVMIEGGVGGGDAQEADRVGARLAAWPVPFPTREAALAHFGGDQASARAWVDGLEARSDGLWPRFDADIMASSLGHVFEHEAWDAWESLRQPTLLVLGEHGTIGTPHAAEMTARHPDAHVTVVPGAGHDIHLDQPYDLAAILRAFATDTS